MNLGFSQEFMKKHKAKILDLFLIYQMIETMLFMKLYLPGVSEIEDRDDYLEDINICDSREKAFMLGELIINSSYEHANSVLDKVIGLSF